MSVGGFVGCSWERLCRRSEGRRLGYRPITLTGSGMRGEERSRKWGGGGGGGGGDREKGSRKWGKGPGVHGQRMRGRDGESGGGARK